jgi:hypothetical protein
VSGEHRRNLRPSRPAGGRIPAARGPSSAPRDGGIKLQVRPEDAARARVVLDTDYSAEMDD